METAREAGALLANYFERRVAVELKGEFDLVTEADRASEKLVVERLRSHFPTHGIVAEEAQREVAGGPFARHVIVEVRVLRLVAQGNLGRKGQEEHFVFDPDHRESGIFDSRTMADYDKNLVNWNGSWIRAPKT